MRGYVGSLGPVGLGVLSNRSQLIYAGRHRCARTTRMRRSGWGASRTWRRATLPQERLRCGSLGCARGRRPPALLQRAEVVLNVGQASPRSAIGPQFLQHLAVSGGIQLDCPAFRRLRGTVSPQSSGAAPPSSRPRAQQPMPTGPVTPRRSRHQLAGSAPAADCTHICLHSNDRHITFITPAFPA